MNSRVRQVLPRATGGLDNMASPARSAGHIPVTREAGNTVRHATAKAPDGAGTIGVAGHVVAPALPADGPGSFPPESRPDDTVGVSSAWLVYKERTADGPSSVICGCYPAPRDESRSADKNFRPDIRNFLPAPDQGTRLLDRIRGDRLHRSASCRAVGTRSGFERDVSLPFEPAPQIFRSNWPETRPDSWPEHSRAEMHAPRIRREIVARARP
ncbi:hypothetical protein EDF56_105166 [Novosphingobium sp. PhB165]|nr:hypothetical protein EDF56_105166 [Novosphingobium sp. PhB165]